MLAEIGLWSQTSLSSDPEFKTTYLLCVLVSDFTSLKLISSLVKWEEQQCVRGYGEGWKGCN